jgi:hypothetical protein
MPRWLIVAAGIVVFVLVVSQLLIPNLAEREVEQRLTEGGGEAQVKLGAVPAARLLFGDGERFEVTARELELGLDEELDVFDRLDGFGVVDVAIDDFRAGPFALDHFELTRSDSGPYRLLSTGHTSPAALVDYGMDALNLPGGPFAGLAVETLFDDADAEIPLELDMTLASDDGRVQVLDGQTSVAGLPAGPFAELITSAIVVQL